GLAVVGSGGATFLAAQTLMAGDRGRWRWGGAEGIRSRAVRSLVRDLLRPIAAGGRKARPPLSSGRRLLLLHLDGVGHSQLEAALREGYVPNIAQLLDSGRYGVSSCRAGAPTSTPAFQAGLLYGCEADIPGYTWYDKRRRCAVRMDCSDDARRLEEELHGRGEPLLEGGSVYCSIFSGGAPRRWALSGIFERLPPEDFGWDKSAPAASRVRDLTAAALVHAATAGRIGGALLLDVASGIVETARWASHVGSLQHEPQFLFHRVLTECLFSEFAANATVLDVARGTPSVYACFIGYDEYAHRRGPYSRMAMLKLFELDRALGRILAAVDAVPELRYEVYLFSDHGQAATRPAEQIVGESIGEHLLSDTPSKGEHLRPVAFGGARATPASSSAARTARWWESRWCAARWDRLRSATAVASSWSAPATRRKSHGWSDIRWRRRIARTCSLCTAPATWC